LLACHLDAEFSIVSDPTGRETTRSSNETGHSRIGTHGHELARRLLQVGHEEVVCNRSPDKTNRLGEKAIYEKLLSLFETLASAEGYLYCSPAGAGHFVKMVHNGIEYGMMQAYGDGFQLLEASPYASTLNYGDIAHLWSRGSVVRSWLLELAEDAFKKDVKHDEITGYVEDSGEGRWKVQLAVETGVPVPVMAFSLFQRFRSRQRDPFSDRVIAALRREFAGHSVALSREEQEK
jgi:6-phosphogluconate dehydrogenase